jgi:hypothetical protein
MNRSSWNLVCACHAFWSHLNDALPRSHQSLTQTVHCLDLLRHYDISYLDSWTDCHWTSYARVYMMSPERISTVHVLNHTNHQYQHCSLSHSTGLLTPLRTHATCSFLLPISDIKLQWMESKRLLHPQNLFFNWFHSQLNNSILHETNISNFRFQTMRVFVLQPILLSEAAAPFTMKTHDICRSLTVWSVTGRCCKGAVMLQRFAHQTNSIRKSSIRPEHKLTPATPHPHPLRIQCSPIHLRVIVWLCVCLDPASMAPAVKTRWGYVSLQ